jgi:hypothetical protein
MGAGKTVVTLAALERLRAEGEISNALIVVPASLKYQWLKEAQRFTTAKCLVIDGTPKQRQDLWRFAPSCDYIIANPESLMKDTHRFDRIRFDCMVVDEATMVKSLRAQRSKFIKKLGKTCAYRFALTGQPIENRPEELFSIMQFVDSSILGKFDSFDRTFIVRDHFGKPVRYRNLDLLHKSLTDVMIRKSREDIADQLPSIITQVIPVPFDSGGATAYRRISNDLLNELASMMSSTGRGFNLFQHYLHNGASAYCYWNLALPHPKGLSTWGWPQNCMITVDPAQQTYALNPEFHLMRLLGHCATPGADIVPLSGHFAAHAVAFRDADTLRVALHNPFPHAQSVTLTHDARSWSLHLPPREIHVYSFPRT